MLRTTSPAIRGRALEEGRKTASMPLAWIQACRPHHWIKNSFVLAPLVFSQNLSNPDAVLSALTYFLAFCLLSSGVYLFNDILDLERDRQHPKKRARPIAAGAIPVAHAAVMSAILATAGVALAATTSVFGLVVAAVYLANNVAYSLVLQHKVVADAMSIAIGFLLRFLGGAFAIDVEVSRWLIVCGFALSLFLAFGKRRAELAQLGAATGTIRPVLRVYDETKLDTALSVSNAFCILSYALFVTDPSGGGRFHDGALIYTLPIVVYCLFRFMFKAQEGMGAGPVEILLRDKVFLAAGLLWVLVVLALLY